MSRYKLEWVVTSSSPVVQFRAEWKMLGNKAEWQSEIVEVSKRLISLVFHPDSSQVRKVGAESYAGEVALEELLPGREYLARVAATNSYGESQPGEGFQVKTPFYNS